MAHLPNAIIWSPEHDLVTGHFGRFGQWWGIGEVGAALPGPTPQASPWWAGPFPFFNSLFVTKQDNLMGGGGSVVRVVDFLCIQIQAPSLTLPLLIPQVSLVVTDVLCPSLGGCERSGQHFAVVSS